MRRLLTPLIIVLALAAALIGAGYVLLHNQAFLKARITAAVEHRTGRNLALDGPLVLQLGRKVVFEAREVGLANVDGAAPADMIQVGRLRASLDLAALWDGRLVLDEFLIQDCQLTLMEDVNGSPNWQGIVPPPEPVQEPPKASPPFELRDAQLQGCRISYSPADRDVPLVLEIDTLAHGIDSEGRATWNGSGRIEDEAWSLAGSVMPLHALTTGRSIDHELELDIGPTRLVSSGSLEDLFTGSGADLTMTLSGPDIGRSLETLLLPPISEGAFRLQANLDTRGGQTRIDLNGDLGSLQVQAKGQLNRLRRPDSGSLDLGATGPDLEAIGAMFGLDGLVREPFSLKGSVAFRQGSAEIQDLAFQTTGDTLQASGKVGAPDRYASSNVSFQIDSAELARWAGRLGLPPDLSGPLSLKGAIGSDEQGMFHAETDFEVARSTGRIEGPLGRLEDGLRPELRFTLDSPDAHGLGAVLGSNRLPAAPLKASGRLAWDGSLARLADIRVDLGGHEAQVDGRLTPGEPWPVGQLSVQLRSPDLRQLGGLFGVDTLPAAPGTVGGQLVATAEALQFEGWQLKLEDHRATWTGSLRPGSPRPTGQLQIDVHSPDLRQLGGLFGVDTLPAAPGTVGGQLVATAEAFQFEGWQLKLEDHRATLTGSLRPGSPRPTGQLQIDVHSPDLNALGTLLGVEGLPGEPMAFKVAADSDGHGLRFRTTQGQVGALRLVLDGEIPNLDRPLALGMDFDLAIPSLAAIHAFAPRVLVPDLPFQAQGTLRNEEDVTRLSDIRLALGDMTGELNGSLADARRFDVRLSARGPDASALRVWTNDTLEAKPFTLDTRIAGDFSSFEFTDIRIALGDSDATGRLRLDLRDPVELNGEAHSKLLDLAYWRERIAANEEEPAEDVERKWLFDDSPIAGIPSNKVLLNLDVTADSVRLPASVLRDFRLGIQLAPQRLALSPLSFREQNEGQMSGSFVLDSSSSVPKLDLNLTGREIRLGLMAAMGEPITDYPPSDIDLRLTGQGATQRDMAASLDGQLRLAVGPGKLASQGVRALFSDFLTELLNLINPFAVRQSYTSVDCAFVAADSNKGQVKITPMIFQTDSLTTLSEGAIDLETEQIALSFQSRARKGLGISAASLINPIINVSGPLAAPSIDLDASSAVLSGGMAVATVGLSVLARTVSDRLLKSQDPCGDALRSVRQLDAEANDVR